MNHAQKWVVFAIFGVSDDDCDCGVLEISDEGFVRGIEERHGCDGFDSGLEHRIVIDSKATVR